MDGKSDYSGAKFSHLLLSIIEDSRVKAEAKHFTDAGRVTIPGGGYTLGDFETGGTLSTVTGDIELKLRKMKYEKPEAEVIRFEDEDVITGSTPLPWDEEATGNTGSSMFSLF
ncbi:MAG: hypothetical protein IJP86_02905 [Synergistaceae bacterium]|nr:hypothetical protein [Synergistaceae bacterium]